MQSINSKLSEAGGRFGRALSEEVTTLEKSLIDFRRHLHAHPEPSGEERETSQAIAKRLREVGIEARVPQRGVGVIADVQLGKPSESAPTIALRSDIDALRMPDEKNVEYRSQNPGVAHACGHDSHATIVLGAALAVDAVNRREEEMPATGLNLRLLFQSSEETSEGAVWLVEDGGLDGVNAILGLHVDPERPVGQIGVRYGILTAYCDEVDIQVWGHGGHAARPHHSVDPIAAVSQLITAMYQFLPRAVDSRNPSVFTVGQISGGYAPNVIPETVALRGTLRTTNADSRATIKKRIVEIAKGIEEMTSARISVQFHAPLSAVDNDTRAAAALEEAGRELLGDDNVIVIDQPSMGGEDFSVYQESVPGALLRLGCAIPGKKNPFLHSPLFDIDERAIGIGSQVLLRAALILAAEIESQSLED